jgi:hypothetical protein
MHLTPHFETFNDRFRLDLTSDEMGPTTEMRTIRSFSCVRYWPRTLVPEAPISQVRRTLNNVPYDCSLDGR